MITTATLRSRGDNTLRECVAEWLSNWAEVCRTPEGDAWYRPRVQESDKPVRLKPDSLEVCPTYFGENKYMVVARISFFDIADMFRSSQANCTELYAHGVSREDAEIIARSYARVHQVPAYINCGREQRKLYMPGDE